MARPSDQGFTLIEMLVALAVFSLAVLALLNLAGENTRTAGAMESRALAAVVAENRAIELLTDQAPPSLGEAQGSETAGGRAFAWRQKVSRAGDSSMARIDVVVGEGEGSQTLAEVTVFRGLR